MRVQNIKSSQTAFRFSPDLLLRMKNKARGRGESLNSYVESLVMQDLGKEEDKYETLFKELALTKLPDKVSDEVNSFMDKYKVEFSEEVLERDERLAYLLSK